MLPSIKKVLYATDLSEGARHALWYAAGIADKYDAEVTVLHVIPDVADEISQGTGIDMAAHFGTEALESFRKQGLEKAQNAVRERIQEACGQAKDELDHCPMTPEHVAVKVGKPAKTIVETAEKDGFDLVIMGTHGHGVFAELVLGSVAHDVIKRSKVPVLVVRLPHKSKSK